MRYIYYVSTQVQGPLRRHQGQVRGRLLRYRAQVQQHRRDGRLHCQGEAQEADSVSVWTVSIFSPKRCTACEVHSSVESTATLSMRGLCQYSYFDTTYQVQCSTVNTVQYNAMQYIQYSTVQYSTPPTRSSTTPQTSSPTSARSRPSLALTSRQR